MAARKEPLAPPCRCPVRRTSPFPIDERDQELFLEVEAESDEKGNKSTGLDTKTGELVAVGGSMMVGGQAWGFLQTISCAAGMNFVFQSLQGVGALMGLNWTDTERKEQ
uniref:Uncharacterized protein n=1 Tax=Chromera velia CCMP2878 TaxID=1169474 RepID=A0A0G4HEG7_9ALVE|eukprot:Cvel_6538.t1-p1 / transcript=Cvel_6538.t1 / gene=Cvel_6538 / organism=Chromera_velia_CCMP2878 / gene_product=hypothetical protein / transcript_product=hypothetical protein / location=Cvel_scaffold322:1513-1836(-) / protein_length=108 / sequence_SO=supercontig / SO=protein_coding / is_pseudo=false